MRLRNAFSIVLVVIVVMVGRFLSGVPVSRYRLAKLKPGMSTNEVRSLLGCPQQTFGGGPPPTNRTMSISSIEKQSGYYPGNTWTTWAYESYFCLRDIEVHFDCDGHYTFYWEN